MMKLLGLLVGVGGALYALGALMTNADSSIQVLMLVIAGGGGILALAGGLFYGLGALLGGGKTSAPPAISPEQQQLRDSREYLAGQGKDDHTAD